MTPIDRFERQLPNALTDLASPRTPDYLIDILGRTARTRQRPAWASIERWLPVQIATSRVMTTRMPWRQLGVLALIALLLAVAIAAYVGSQQRKLPPPFGQASNGSIVFSKDGDIVSADLAAGDTKIIIGGPERDLDPVFSLDGTRLLFARHEGNTTKSTLYVAREDGTGLKPLTAKPIIDPRNWSFSPDGRWVTAFAVGDNGNSIIVIPSDGSAEPTYYPVFATRDDSPPQYRADGSEILFIGHDPAQPFRGVYALVLATKEVRTIVAPRTDVDIHGASWSPDGMHVAYGALDPYKAAELSARTHVVGADGSGDVMVDTDPTATADAGLTWSNDGTRLIVGRFRGDRSGEVAIVPIDRSGPGVVIDCSPNAVTEDCNTTDWMFSPDDSVLIGPAASGAHMLADPLTGKVRAAAWTGDRPSWQRLALAN
jgi:hypothetical protein